MELTILGIWIIIGLIIGSFGGYFIGKFSLKSKTISKIEAEKINEELITKKEELNRIVAHFEAKLDSSKELLGLKESEIEALKNNIRDKDEKLQESNNNVAILNANNTSLTEKLNTQKEEIEKIGEKFNKDFEIIAARILDEKSTKFSKQNKENIEQLLKPLGENIENFRKKVEEVYDKEAKERFSLGKEVEKLVELNKQVSEEANNLTKALKGSAKIQGDWGEMILQNILEQSGLSEGREYFTQEYLKDEFGNNLTGEEGKRLRPDVVINYPDSRKVIIDSKVSLVAYTNYTEEEDSGKQKEALKRHIVSVKSHIDKLAKTSYHDHKDSLDFVMMFIPIEPAYLLVLKEDPDLWAYAYKQKILLISPTNLIAALKLIEDLWKREYQNQNAMAIAERGAALYDKLVGFVDKLNGVGKSIDKAQVTFNEAYRLLNEGPGNLIGQAVKLRNLGINPKKNLPQGVVDQAILEDEK